MIVGAFDHTDPDLPVQERVALGLKRCGVSVSCELSKSALVTVITAVWNPPVIYRSDGNSQLQNYPA